MSLVAADGDGMMVIRMSEVMASHLPLLLLANVAAKKKRPCTLRRRRRSHCRNPIRAYRCSPCEAFVWTMLLRSRRGPRSSPRDKGDNSETALNSNSVHLSAMICCDNFDSASFENDNPSICVSLITESLRLLGGDACLCDARVNWKSHRSDAFIFSSSLSRPRGVRVRWRWWTRIGICYSSRKKKATRAREMTIMTVCLKYSLLSSPLHFLFTLCRVLLFTLSRDIELVLSLSFSLRVSHSRKLTFWFNYTSLGIYSS